MKAIKTRNNGTMTESAFLGFIRSTLRRASRWWKPIQECKKLAKRKYVGPNKRLKFEYQCEHCKGLFPEKEIQVDHIVEVGSLKSLDDLKGFVERLFAEAGAYQILCKPCHQVKTNKVKEKA